jgi:hypothetical protein
MPPRRGWGFYACSISTKMSRLRRCDGWTHRRAGRGDDTPAGGIWGRKRWPGGLFVQFACAPKSNAGGCPKMRTKALTRISPINANLAFCLTMESIRENSRKFAEFASDSGRRGRQRWPGGNDL